MDPLLAISFASFSNIWFWVILSVSWSVTCHITLGVPYDLLTRAERQGGAAAQDVEALALVHGRRLRGYFAGPTSRMVGVMLLTFFLAVLGTFGFYYTYEFAAALFVLLAPLILVQILAIRLAFRMERDGLEGAELRAALLRRRFWNQVIGLISIVAVAMVAFLTFARSLAIWY